MLGKNESAAMDVVKPATQRKTRPAERVRLAEDSRCEQCWKLWGPYLSERQWGTVREDYSSNGTAWDYFPSRSTISSASVRLQRLRLAC